MKTEKLDILAFGAHPDDVELSASGTLISLISRGFKAGIVDLTQGEMGTRGTPQIRKKEAARSSEVMKLNVRENLRLKDGHLSPYDLDSIIKIVKVIRKYRPEILIANYFNDRHPDHVAAGLLVKRAFYFAGLKKFEEKKLAGLPPFRPQKIFYYMQTFRFEPSFIYDISETFDTKLKSILCFSSQFYNPDSKEPETFISTQGFLDSIRDRAATYGFYIRKKFGEPFYCEESINYNFSTMFSDLQK